jgi:hypothetical protein
MNAARFILSLSADLCRTTVIIRRDLYTFHFVPLAMRGAGTEFGLAFLCSPSLRHGTPFALVSPHEQNPANMLHLHKRHRDLRHGLAPASQSSHSLPR